MIKKDDFHSGKSVLAIIIFVSIFGCFEKKRLNTPLDDFSSNLTQNDLDSISLMWRYDTSGCLGQRNAIQVKQIVEGYDLRGKVTSNVINILGVPDDTIIFEDLNRGFVYYMDCENKGEQSRNFSCFFKEDTLKAYHISLR